MSNDKLNEQEANIRAQKQWDKDFNVFGRNRDEIKKDNWIDLFCREIELCPSPIIDLGCGGANNTLYLVEKGKEVIPCDYSKVAIQNIKRNFPEIKDVKLFDMTKGLPFQNNYTDIIISDLSLYYFTEKTTNYILNEIKRVLKPNGKLLFRVNSIKDVNYGAGQGKTIEYHLYKTPDGRYKRFFDRNDILHFFDSDSWYLTELQEETMGRYGKEKVVWRGSAQIKK